MAEEEELSPEDIEQKILQSLPHRVRLALFQDKTRQAKQFAVNMLRDNKKHAQAFDHIKRQRSAEIAKEKEQELASKMVYNNKVKESKQKIVASVDIEWLL